MLIINILYSVKMYYNYCYIFQSDLYNLIIVLFLF